MNVVLRASMAFSLVFMAGVGCNTEFNTDVDGDAPDGFDASTEPDLVPDGEPDVGPDGGPECGNGEREGDEQCDDGNDVDGDGCDSDCTYSCSGDDDCLDDNVCNGAEFCDGDAHVCEAGAPLGDGHLVDVGPPRIICLEGNPAESTCGDGFVDEAGGEFCEPPGSGGCNEECRWGCESDTECPDDGVLCNGEEYCDTTAHACDRRNVPSSGTGCNDGLFCTSGETCDGAGSCTGGSATCVDGLTCTDDRCDESADSCSHPLMAGNCLIGGACFGDGALNPGDECEECRSSSSTTAFVDRTDGSSCTADSYSCTEDVCLSGACEHPVDSGRCLIGTTCYSDRDVSSTNECEECDSSTSRSSWSPRSDGTPCSPDIYGCTDDVCQSGACSHPISSGWCRISGTCYVDGARDPGNDCRLCDEGASQTSWTTDVGHPCDDGDWCTSSDMCTSTATCVGAPVTNLPGAVQITAGQHHSCAIVDTDRLRCWGYNVAGAVGDGTTAWRWAPVDVTGLTSGVAQVDAGEFHTCAVTSAGGARCWGWNNDGAIGDGTFGSGNDRHTPVDVSGLSTGVQQVCGGWAHSCALLSSGQVRCWGDNYYGQLGDGSNTDRHTPATVLPVTGSGALSGIAEIACGYQHTCARTSGLQVVCWGRNYEGQVGAGESTPSTVNRPYWVDTSATDTAPLSGVRQISIGGYHSCARMSDTKVKCWGRGGSGELGYGGIVNQGAPVYVNIGMIAPVDMTGALEVAAGGYHTCARVTGNYVRCWGDAEYGQLGHGVSGSGVQANQPVYVQTSSTGGNFTPSYALALGQHHSLTIAHTSDYVMGWGRNNYGNLGIGVGTTLQLYPIATVCGP